MDFQTKKRLGTYKEMLQLYVNSPDFRISRNGFFYTNGFCYALTHLNEFDSLVSCFISDYPELYVYKPENTKDTDYWYPINSMYGYDTRIQILMEIIKKLELEFRF